MYMFVLVQRNGNRACRFVDWAILQSTLLCSALAIWIVIEARGEIGLDLSFSSCRRGAILAFLTAISPVGVHSP